MNAPFPILPHHPICYCTLITPHIMESGRTTEERHEKGLLGKLKDTIMGESGQPEQKAGEKVVSYEPCTFMFRANEMAPLGLI